MVYKSPACTVLSLEELHKEKQSQMGTQFLVVCKKYLSGSSMAEMGDFRNWTIIPSWYTSMMAAALYNRTSNKHLYWPMGAYWDGNTNSKNLHNAVKNCCSNATGFDEFMWHQLWALNGGMPNPDPRSRMWYAGNSANPLENQLATYS